MKLKADMFIQQIPLWITQTNCWIVSNSNQMTDCVLIDVPPEVEPIIQIITKNRLRPKIILATHGHIDHVGGIGTVSRFQSDKDNDPNIPVYLHQNDTPMLLEPRKYAGLLADEINKLDLDLRPPTLISEVEDNDKITEIGLEFKVLHTPGHTSGSICFLVKDTKEDQSVLFSGDHLFKGSIGRTDLPGGSFEQLIESMQSKIFPLDDGLTVLPGHGDFTNLKTEKESNPFLRNI